MGIDVTAFGLPFLLTKEKGKEGKKPPRKEMRYRVFSDVNGIGRPKTVISIPFLLGHYNQLLSLLEN